MAPAPLAVVTPVRDDGSRSAAFRQDPQRTPPIY
jgi:hypothetical protein